MNNMTEREPTIYEKMAREKIKVAGAQIKVLNFYDTPNEENRLQQLHGASRYAIMEHQSEKALEKIDEIISAFDSEIKKYRQANPKLEQENKELRESISVIEEILSSQ